MSIESKWVDRWPGEVEWREEIVRAACELPLPALRARIREIVDDQSGKSHELYKRSLAADANTFEEAIVLAIRLLGGPDPESISAACAADDVRYRESLADALETAVRGVVARVPPERVQKLAGALTEARRSADKVIELAAALGEARLRIVLLEQELEDAKRRALSKGGTQSFAGLAAAGTVQVEVAAASQEPTK